MKLKSSFLFSVTPAIPASTCSSVEAPKETQWQRTLRELLQIAPNTSPIFASFLYDTSEQARWGSQGQSGSSLPGEKIDK